MKKLKRLLVGFLAILICACFQLNVAEASKKFSTDVLIQIEPTQEALLDDCNDSEKMEQIQTGDKSVSEVYVVTVMVAVITIVTILIRRKKMKGMLAVLTLFCAIISGNHISQAADSTENVNVTIPTSISIIFQEKGANSISDFVISNQSPLPITLDSVDVTAYNEWELVEEGQKISVNTKQMVFKLEGQCLQNGKNQLNLSVQEHSNRKLEMEIKRGAWTVLRESESAFKFEFEYAFDHKEFKLNFNVNGGTTNVSAMQVLNGESVTLPTVSKPYYAFGGWQDSAGNIYTNTYIMPSGDVTLTAKWLNTTAYAVYSADDGSLSFYRSSTAITAGTVFNGKTATAVYTGFEDANYTDKTAVPWDAHRKSILRIVAEDEIKPACMAYWFVSFINCSYVDVGKIDTTRVITMRQTFSLVGNEVTGQVTILGIDKWNVSNVQNTRSMFNGVGYKSSGVSMPDLSGWDVSNVTDMANMFNSFAKASAYKLDFRCWDVRNVVKYFSFNAGVETKIICPIWVN